jgi:tetratricopeptide (TPR) repeat protein
MKPKRDTKKLPTALPFRGPGTLLSFAVLAILALVSYWNSLDVPFVFDDLLSIQANSGVQFGDFLKPQLLATRPLLYLTFAINYQIHRQQVLGYHLVNLVLHVLNGMLVLLVATHIFSQCDSTKDRARVYGLLAAALFVVHPIQTESVTYISSRSELLSTLFYGICVLLFIKRDDRKIGFVWSLVVLVPFFLGILSKETVISLPAVLLAYDFLFFARSDVRAVLGRWRFYLMYVAGGLAAVAVLLKTGVVGSIGADVAHLSPWQYFLTELRVVSSYVRLLFIPAGLNINYDVRPSSSLFEPAVLAALLFLTLLLFLAWRLRRSQPMVSFSIIWFFLTLAPTSSFVPIPDVIFEHRLYLPLVGVCLSFPILMSHVAGRGSLVDRRRLTATVTGCAAVLVALVFGTVLRNQVWRDPVRLWSDSLAKSPHHPRPYNSLAMEYLNRRDYPRAIEISQQGLRNVDDPRARGGLQNAIGTTYLQLHQYEQAVAMFKEAAKDGNRREAGKAYNNLGVSYINLAGDLEQHRTQLGEDRFQVEKQRLLEDAVSSFRKSAELDESMFVAFDSYINVSHQIGRAAELEADFRARLKGKTDYRWYYGLGKLALLSANYAAAAEDFQRSVQVNALQKIILYNYALALSAVGRRDEAIQQYTFALRLDPMFLPAYSNLGLLYMHKKDFPNAIASFETVLRSDPNHTTANLNLARIYMQTGNRALARDHVSRVLSVSPANQEAAALWRELGS